MPWPVSEIYVVEAEKGVNSTLPKAYRLSMVDLNGGTVKCSNDFWTLHPIWDKKDKKRLSRTSNDIVRETKAMGSWEGWPENAVCIAGNGTGDVLLFLTENKICLPMVYRWDHETGQINQVSNDFSELTKT